jgi:hypothetical protein
MFALVVRFDCRDEAAAARFDELTAVAVRQITDSEPRTSGRSTRRRTRC